MPAEGTRGPAGWLLTPEGAAVYRRARTAVVADVHLGYEWARGEAGDCIPAHSLAETLAKLTRLLEGGGQGIRRLVVAGDLVESPRLCRRTDADVRALSDWLAARGVTLLPLAGNHDPAQSPPWPETIEVGGWTVGHGHRPIAAARTISGHIHPVLRAEGLTVPCFLVGSNTIILPAFSNNAAGGNVAAGPVRSALGRGTRLRCLAAAGADVLDFGPVETLAERLRNAHAAT